MGCHSSNVRRYPKDCCGLSSISTIAPAANGGEEQGRHSFFNIPTSCLSRCCTFLNPSEVIYFESLSLAMHDMLQNVDWCVDLTLDMNWRRGDAKDVDLRAKKWFPHMHHLRRLRHPSNSQIEDDSNTTERQRVSNVVSLINPGDSMVVSFAKCSASKTIDYDFEWIVFLLTTCAESIESIEAAFLDTKAAHREGDSPIDRSLTGNGSTRLQPKERHVCLVNLNQLWLQWCPGETYDDPLSRFIQNVRLPKCRSIELLHTQPPNARLLIGSTEEDIPVDTDYGSGPHLRRTDTLVPQPAPFDCFVKNAFRRTFFSNIFKVDCAPALESLSILYSPPLLKVRGEAADFIMPLILSAVSSADPLPVSETCREVAKMEAGCPSLTFDLLFLGEVSELLVRHARQALLALQNNRLCSLQIRCLLLAPKSWSATDHHPAGQRTSVANLPLIGLLRDFGKAVSGECYVRMSWSQNEDSPETVEVKTCKEDYVNSHSLAYQGSHCPKGVVQLERSALRDNTHRGRYHEIPVNDVLSPIDVNEKSVLVSKSIKTHPTGITPIVLAQLKLLMLTEVNPLRESHKEFLAAIKLQPSTLVRIRTAKLSCDPAEAVDNLAVAIGSNESIRCTNLEIDVRCDSRAGSLPSNFVLSRMRKVSPEFRVRARRWDFFKPPAWGLNISKTGSMSSS